MIGYANSAGDRWVAWVVAATLDAALLLALIGLLWLVIRNRVTPQVGYGLFLPVPHKVLVPVVVTVPAALALWTPSSLLSSWSPVARVPERIASEPSGEPRMAAVGVETPARRFESRPVVTDAPQQSSPTEPHRGRLLAPRLDRTAGSTPSHLAGSSDYRTAGEGGRIGPADRPGNADAPEALTGYGAGERSRQGRVRSAAQTASSSPSAGGAGGAL